MKGLVLIADDEAAPRILGRRVLEPSGYTGGREAADGPQAIEAVIARLPDLRLLDLEMPEVDGCG